MTSTSPSGSAPCGPGSGLLFHGPDVLPPTRAELDILTAALRGHMELLAPEVEQATGRLDEESIPRFCALACVGEARRKLSLEPRPGLNRAASHARRLARVLNALCDHYQDLTGGKP
ncbi:DUF6415 family natural product biosynthesis protein [Streptomyces sp. NPDC051963]|uniref:DUF6415 family natural product biosynthesis protein n=1 Tax=Streptomyces sp. NPDC051963 TaxID=3365678 RepID=UPI0037D7A2AA